MSGTLCAARISALLNRPELPVAVFGTLDSTNDECRRRLKAGERQCLVLAEQQTGGRGRSGKPFFSPPGGLYMSLAFPAPPALTGLTCRAAVAAAEAIAAVTGLQCGIKWVNDLYLDGRKVCGILAEAEGGSVILGIGVNLRETPLPPELAERVGFLNCGDRREELAAAITAELLRTDRPDAAVMEAYRQRSLMPGRLLRFRTGDRERTARCLGIDDDGGLIVETEDGTETLRWGEITFFEKHCWL